MTKIAQILESLNSEQKKAAQAIEGPVQVIAGPGTGKTQILASRIANILASTDTDPWNILCLTFTEAGVVAMRNRLLSFIGPTAHQVQLHTFHSLCNQIIQDNQEFFGTNRLAPIDDIESEKLMRSICESIEPGTVLYSAFDAYFYKYDLGKVFQTFKKENLNRKQIEERCNALIGEMDNDENYRYKTNRKGKWEKGDLNTTKYNKDKKKLDKLIQAAELFEQYQNKLTALQRYDFDDMILWVIEAFQKHQDLLFSYQEQFQYVLTDEFQDTNGAQFKLIQLLMSHWESPNIFSVGDDDQSIYAFQGANVANMLNFGTSFKMGLQEFVLTTNYRSSPEILETAGALILNNQERLVRLKDHITKDLVAAKSALSKPVVAECETPLQEASYVTKEIEKLLKQGCAPNDIAVLYNKHKHSRGVHSLLQSKNIAVNLHKSDNIFEVSIIDFIIRVLRYINAELNQPFSAEHELFRILHAPFFKISSITLAEKAFEMSKKKGKERLWRRALQKEEPTLFDTAPLRTTMNTIEGWIDFASNNSPINVLDLILKESGALKHYNLPGTFHLEISSLSTLFNFVRDRNEKSKDYTLNECITELDLLKNSQGVRVVNNIKTEQGVNFVSIHSSKGLEFKHVFVLANTAANWKSGRDGSISLRPLFGKHDDKEAQLEENRRLLYVAITRAEESLTLSYYNENLKGKSESESAFISELKSSGTIENIKVNNSQDELVNSALQILSNPEIKIKLPSKDYIQKHLENYVLSATHMNRYLKCPVGFYYENLLRVPSSKSEAGCIGTAVHDALHTYFKVFKEEGSLPDPQQLMTSLEYKMNDQYIYFNKATFHSKLSNAKDYLMAYYETNKKQWELESVFTTEKNLNAVLGETKIKGFLDKLIFDGNNVEVVDYKTGNPANAIKKMKAPKEEYDGDDVDKKYGGEYWRQLMFYHFLVNGDTRYAYKMTKGIVSCVERDRDTKAIVDDLVLVPDLESLEMVSELIQTTYANIKAQRFDDGCGKIGDSWQDCEWCTFQSKLK